MFSRVLIALVLAITLGSLLSGCQPQKSSQRELFEEAEIAYQRGDYDLAVEKYEAFRKASPEHQLAALANRRIDLIKREVNHVLGRKDGPLPFYIRPLDPDETPLATGIVRPLPNR